MSIDPRSGFEPAALLDQITAATGRLLADAAELGDADMREPSLLPGWSRGHVLTHLARNADGGTRLLTWARTGTPAAEYPSLQARAAQIEEGSGRDAAELVADVQTSAGHFATQYALMSDEAWQRTVQWTAGQRLPAARVADARLCEVLIHHVDLRAGLTPDDWPADFVAYELDIVTRALNARDDAPAMRLQATDTDAAVRQVLPRQRRPLDIVRIRGRQASLLAWLMGRSPGDDLTTASGEPLPDPPFLY